MQVASRMVSAFSRWKRYDETRQSLAKVIWYPFSLNFRTFTLAFQLWYLKNEVFGRWYFVKATDVSIFFFEFLKLYSSSLFLTHKEIDEIKLVRFFTGPVGDDHVRKWTLRKRVWDCIEKFGCLKYFLYLFVTRTYPLCFCWNCHIYDKWLDYRCTAYLWVQTNMSLVFKETSVDLW